MIDKEKLGTFKDESHNISKKRYKKHYDKRKCDEIPNVNSKKVNYYKIKDPDNPNKVKEMIVEDQSFQLWGSPRHGKSYMVKHKIIPWLKKYKKKFIMTSTTDENCEQFENDDIECITIQSVWSKQHLLEIERKFSEINYLIIDESSQLDQSILKKLEWIVNNTDCKLILVGDQFQCPSVDAEKIIQGSWLTTDFVHKITDFNVFEIMDHKNVALDEKMKKVVNKLKANFENVIVMRKIVYETFPTMKKTKTKLNMVRTHDKGTEVNNKGKEYKTVHAYQGQSICEPYTIHQVNGMTSNILYTAVSRSLKFKYISVIKN